MSDHFLDFNYSLANEDTAVERKAALKSRSILAVCGSGARVIPLLHPTLQSMTVVDLSEAQLNYLKFKQICIRSLEIPDYTALLGYTRAPREFRENLLRALPLDPALRAWASGDEALEKGLIYCGRWETGILKMSRRIRDVLGIDFSPLFEARTAAEQREVFDRLWPRWRLRILLALFANRSSLNRQAYSGGLRASHESLSSVLRRNFEFFFRERPARESFFHQLLFLGELRHPEGFPLEVQPEILRNFRDFRGELHFVQRNLTQTLGAEIYDLLSLSDVPTHLDDQALRDLQNGLSRQFRHGARAAWVRTFLRHPVLQPEDCRVENHPPWEDSTGLYRLQLLQGAHA